MANSASLVVATVVLLALSALPASAALRTGGLGPGNSCFVGTRGAQPCPSGFVCVLDHLGRPEVDVPHTGTCRKPNNITQCQLEDGNVYAGGKGLVLPSPDGCNTCACLVDRAKKEPARTVCTLKACAPPVDFPSEDSCPPGQPLVQCLKDPCQGAECAGYPHAECRSNYCGACNAVFVVDGEAVNCTNPTGGEAGCMCPFHVDPVCGADGQTYSNACLAGCAKVPVVSKGECPGECMCPDDYTPVCGADGKTYSNACRAACQNVTVAAKGECQVGCQCAEIYSPVCGADGRTYGNSCEAKCQNVAVVSAGECPSPPKSCICNKRYDPGCGVDGKTYGNSCMAKCVNVTVAHSGPCSGDSEEPCVAKCEDRCGGSDGCGGTCPPPSGLYACGLCCYSDRSFRYQHGKKGDFESCFQWCFSEKTSSSPQKTERALHAGGH